MKGARETTGVTMGDDDDNRGSTMGNMDNILSELCGLRSDVQGLKMEKTRMREGLAELSDEVKPKYRTIEKPEDEGSAQPDKIR